MWQSSKMQRDVAGYVDAVHDCLDQFSQRMDQHDVAGFSSPNACKGRINVATVWGS
jgi:hypothetical protein